MLGLRRVGMEVRVMTETVHVTWSPGRADVSPLTGSMRPSAAGSKGFGRWRTGASS